MHWTRDQGYIKGLFESCGDFHKALYCSHYLTSWISGKAVTTLIYKLQYIFIPTGSFYSVYSTRLYSENFLLYATDLVTLVI